MGGDLWRRLVRIQGMRIKAIASLTLLGLALAAALGTGTALAKGMGAMPVPGGIALPGSPFRYQTFAPGEPDRITVIARINREGGKASRWWGLPGGWFVPGVTPSVATGLSADGSRLVLVRRPTIGPHHAAPDTDLAIVRPQIKMRRTAAGFPHWVDFVRLPGERALLAISPDGATAYLRGNSEVRALDTGSGELRPARDGVLPRFDGYPFDQVGGRGGSWTYTLFGDHRGRLLVYALDSVAGKATRIELPWLRGLREPYSLHLELEGGGGRLEVVRRWFPEGEERERMLAVIDTTSFAIRDPATRVFASIIALLRREVGNY